MVSTGGDGAGVTKIAADMTQVVAQVPALIEALTRKMTNRPARVLHPAWRYWVGMVPIGLAIRSGRAQEVAPRADVTA